MQDILNNLASATWIAERFDYSRSLLSKRMLRYPTFPKPLDLPHVSGATIFWWPEMEAWHKRSRPAEFEDIPDAGSILPHLANVSGLARLHGLTRSALTGRMGHRGNIKPLDTPKCSHPIYWAPDVDVSPVRRVY